MRESQDTPILFFPKKVKICTDHKYLQRKIIQTVNSSAASFFTRKGITRSICQKRTLDKFRLAMKAKLNRFYVTILRKGMSSSLSFKNL